MALVTKNFSDIITFTRASTATYFDSAGVLQSAAINEARFDYDPSTLAAQGLLIEEARTNIILQSADFATTWVKDANSTLTVDAEVAPNGLTVADKLAVGTSSFPQIAQSVTSSASSTYTFSCFVKAGGLNFIQLRLRNTGTPANFFRAIFDLSTGAISLPANGGTGTYTTGSASFVGNGWWRLSITGVPDTGGGAAIQVVAILTLDANGTVATSSNSAATDGVLFFGAQLEAGAFPTSYIPTTTTALTRNADQASVNTLSPWFNASAGTTYFEGVTFDSLATAFPRAYQFNDGTNNNVIQITRNNGSGAARMSVVSGGASQAAADATAWTLNATTKAALAYATNDFAIVANGGAATTDTSGTVPTVTNLLLGSQIGGVSFLNGYLRRITYYPRRLSQAELTAITA